MRMQLQFAFDLNQRKQAPPSPCKRERDGIDLAVSLFVLLIIRLYRSALSGEPVGQARDARAGCQ